MKNLYQADDGTRFDNEWDCEDYENKLNHPYLKNIEFFTKEGHPYSMNDDNFLADSVYFKSEKMIVHNEDELKDLKWTINYCGWIEYTEITEPGIWERYEEGDEDDFRDVFWRKINEQVL